MFLGHPAVGLASKRRAARVSLGLLVLAPMLLDFLWPVFLLLGIEHFRIDPGNTVVTPLDFYDYPWSHSLLMAVVWSVFGGAAYWLWRRDRSGSVIIGLGIVSHWFLDLIAHRPDLPLYPGGPKFGLGLWNSVAATAAVESLLFAGGVWLYVSSTRARDRVGLIGFWALVAILAGIFIANLIGPPPPDAKVVAWMSLALLFVPLWAGWVDRHRENALSR